MSDRGPLVVLTAVPVVDIVRRIAVSYVWPGLRRNDRLEWRWAS